MLYAARRLLANLAARQDRVRLRARVPDLASVFDRSGTTQERHYWTRIEQRRAVLLASDEVIRFPEHGAGTLCPGATPGTRCVGELTRVACKPRRWAEVLFHLVRVLRPTLALELGTCVGISGAYQASALKLNGGGRLLTLEGAEAAARIAREGFRALALERHAEVIVGRFADRLPGVLEAATEPFGYVFIDGHHEEKATLDYYAMIRPRLAPRALVIFDDIRWSEGMTRAWREVCADPAVQVAIDCGPVGICLLDQAAPTGRYRIRFV